MASSAVVKVLLKFVVTWELDFVRKIMTDNKSGDLANFGDINTSNLLTFLNE